MDSHQRSEFYQGDSGDETKHAPKPKDNSRDNLRKLNDGRVGEHPEPEGMF
jgi:hypothetical protein